MTTDPNEALRMVRKEFSRGLPNRLEKIQAALTALHDGFDEGHAEQFHIASHALAGMAATFEAHDMAECAHALAQLGRRWRKEGTASQTELDEARSGVGLLDATIAAFTAQADGDESSDVRELE